MKGAWQQGGAPAYLSHQTCPVQSQNTDVMDEAPQTILALSAFWFLGDPPPGQPSCTNLPPTLTALLIVHKTSHPCAFLASRAFFGAPSSCLGGLRHGLLGSGLSSCFLPLCLNLQSWVCPADFLNAFAVCSIHLRFHTYYLVYVFHWFLCPPPHFNIFWIGMHIQLMMLV